MIFLKLCQCLTLSLACWQMAQMNQITQICAGDRKCTRMCAGLHTCLELKNISRLIMVTYSKI